MMLPNRPSAAPNPTVELAEDMRQRIVSLELKPGLSLSRKDLQDHYRVSSTPVRDMLLKLQEDGLVEIFPQSRTIVSLIDLEQARQAHFLRSSVECAIVQQLAAAPDPVLTGALQNILHLQEKSAPSDLATFAALDKRFHQELFVSAGMMHVYGVIRRESMHIDRIRALHLPVGGKAAQILRDHRQIIDGIKAADPARAARAMGEHLSQSIAIAGDLRNTMPAYFR